ncbi:MAG TPA: PAS domain S-box protein, partial [Saprospiraceae bacterium]|nr:PAS domain S-box protein [Saprospiraceae bacterium]
PELRELLEKILPEKSVFFGFEMTHNFPNIGERTMLLNAREIVKEDNNEPLILLAIRDVTDKRIVEKNLAKSENKFQRLAEFMPQMVWTGDQDGKQNYFNQNFLDFIPFNLDELIKQGWHIAIHPDDWKEDKKIWENALENSHDFKMQHRILNKNGEYIWFLTRGISTKDELGNINMWICTSTEIQDQKTLQEVLEKAIEERTNELQGANKALVEKNRELQSFAYVTSHDLQEPLRKFLTFMERIKTNESKNLSAEGLVFLNRMGNTILRMRQLITDLLTFSKIDMEERKFEKTKLSKSIREVARELKESLAVVRAKIVVEAEDEINVVPFQFQQLMHNLINNSIKYSKPGVPLKIIIKSNIAKGKEFINKDFEKFHIHLNPEKLYCHLSVADNGIGFESQYSLRIFEIFQKLHSRDQYAGTGIGLAIVKRIIETHNAFITADGELDKAAVFNMYFPV